MESVKARFASLLYRGSLIGMDRVVGGFYASICGDASVSEIDTYGIASSRFPEVRRTDSDVQESQV